MVEFFSSLKLKMERFFSNGLFHLITSYTQIIAVHYGVITNMAAIALIHLFIYECIISEFAPHSLSLSLYLALSQSKVCSLFFFASHRAPSKSKKLFPPFSRAYNNAR